MEGGEPLAPIVRPIVQKYGGSSLATADRIKAVAERIAASWERSDGLVVVVSAMGDTTDDLIQLARQVSDDPDDREMDLLLSTGELISCTLVAMALRARGCPSVSLTGAQAGIRTDATHSRARIAAVEPARVQRELAAGRVVIVAGFQGVTDEHDVTTLGRGGSDTTAVALAAILRARVCEIYTDVEGVYTADPRLEPRARKLAEINYEEMLELAQQGARVMHPRAVELGSVYDIPILVASSFADRPGTLIHDVPLVGAVEVGVAPNEDPDGGAAVEIRNKVRGIAHDTNVAKVTVVGVPDRPGIAGSLFRPLAEASISVDVIVQNTSLEGVTDLSFTVTREDLPRTIRLIETAAAEAGARKVVGSAGLAKVSIVGTGIHSAPGYAARMFEALSSQGINIDMITTSEIRITCIVADDRVADAVRALHEAFSLEQPDLQS